MNYRTIALGFALAFSASIALAQVDPATGTVTNDATMARLRVSNCVWRGPPVDVLLDGELAVNGGMPQTTDRNLYTFGYLYLTPGTHSIAVVPTGQGIDQALLQPVDVQVAAGHRYTLVVMGQADEPNHEALVIDETQAYRAIGATPTDTPHITINNIKGPAGISFILDGAVREDNVPFGGFQAAFWPLGWFTGLDLSFRDAENNVIGSDGFSDKGWNRPEDFMDCVGGTTGEVGQVWFNWTASSTSTLSALDWLGVVSSMEASQLTFNTFLSAVEIAGLSDVLATGDPYFLLAPTDEAFAALPTDQLAALMADPEALADLLRYHIIEGYYPEAGLPVENGMTKRLMTMLGFSLRLSGETNLEVRYTSEVNGIGVGDMESLVVANGSRVKPISVVLLPPGR